MIVPMVSMPESEQPDHVDQKPKRTHDKQLLDTAKLPTLHHAFGSLPDEFHADQHKEDSVSESRERVEFAPAIGHFGASRPLGGDSGAKTDDKSQAIEKHMYSVAEKTEGAAEIAVQALNEHECEVETACFVSAGLDTNDLDTTYHVK